VILLTVWIKAKAEGSVSSFVSTVLLHRMSENMTGTDQDDTEIDSRLPVSLCCENSAAPDLYPANYGKSWQQMSPFG
jgi:hypothetical protein